MTKLDKEFIIFMNKGGFILLLVVGLLFVFIMNHFSRRGIEGLIKSEKTVIEYFELTEKIKHLEIAFLNADIHYHKYLISGQKENFDLVTMDLKGASEWLSEFEALQKKPTDKANEEVKKRITRHIESCKRLLKLYQMQLASNTISNAAYEKIEGHRDRTVVTMNDLENYLKQIIIPNLKEKRNFGNWVIFIDMVSFFLTVLIVIAAIWLYINYTGQQSQLRKSLEHGRQETEKTALLKEQFLTNTSHEIRTPLNAVLAFTNLLQKENLNPKQRELVTGIKHSGNSLLSLINNILDFSKLESDMMPLEVAPFNPGELVQSVVQMFQSQVSQKNIELVLFVGKNLPEVVEGDPTRLSQVLVNLVGNAIKFTEKGKVEVHAHFIRRAGNTCRLGFKVNDTGIGISEDKQKTIFERFVQGNAQLNRGQGGTGLGLAIVKKIIDLQNGKISLKSKVGEGSTFYFEIPYQCSEKKLKEKNTLSDQEITAFPPDLRLLVVEDNAMNRRVMELLFGDWKINFDLAKNGKEAIDRVTNQTYDLILMDIQMPEMDGYETTTYLRQHLHLQVPIIAMTAHAIAGEVEKCMQVGMNDYISKPFEEKDLIRLILKYINTKEDIKPIAKSLLDLDYLKEISRGKPERIRDLATIFIQHAPKELTALGLAIKNKDFSTINTIAHSMKTTAGFMGLRNSLGKILKDIESEAETTQDLEQLKKQFFDLQQTTEAAIMEIQKSILL